MRLLASRSLIFVGPARAKGLNVEKKITFTYVTEAIRASIYNSSCYIRPFNTAPLRRLTSSLHQFRPSNSAFTLATCCHTCRHTSRRTCRPCERTQTQVAQLVAESFPTGDMCADLLPTHFRAHVSSIRQRSPLHADLSAHMSSNKLLV